MVMIELAKPWSYRTPLVTINYPAGENRVFKYIAEQAVADGAIKGYDDGNTGKPSDGGTAGDPDQTAG